MTPCRAHPVQSPTIPDALIEHEQWICWRIKDWNENATKVPIVPGTGEYASATDPETCRSFNEALEYCECGGAAGIGFVFTKEDPFVRVDLDGCRDPETRSPSTDAREIILELNSFTEVSPSGTGYHIIVRGSIPGDRRRRGSVEIYETARFFTVTGDHIDMTPARVRDRSGALETVYNEFIDETGSRGRTEAGRQHAAAESKGVALADEELLKRARNARNGEKFNRLWRGSTIGYESHSEADMALCCLLAFWTGGNATRVDQLFRRSRLMRGKWDDVHYSDGSTYGEKTVERALANTNEVYDPSHSQSGESQDG